MTYLALTLLGVAAWRNIPIELLPNTTLPRLNVTAFWRGASPEAMEAFVTAPLEAAVQQVRGVAKVISTSFDRNGVGQATINLDFARGTDMDFARLELRERLGALRRDLPAGAMYSIATYVPREFAEQSRPFLSYTITGPYTLEALRAHVDAVIEPAIRQVDGVDEVRVAGGRARLLEIVLDQRKVLALGLTLQRVTTALANLEYVREAGVVERGGLDRTLAIRQRAATSNDIQRLVLLSDRGRVVRVGDVATIHQTFEDPTDHNRIDAQPSVSFFIQREARTNAIRVADSVKATLAALASQHPIGARLMLDNDESEAIRTQLADLRVRTLVSAAVIFVVLLLFVRSFRSATMVFATIAFSILITLNLMYFAGFTLNVLTLMGLAMSFGIIVDNAIVILENVYRKGREGLTAARAAEEGSREVVVPILASTLTTMIVFIPFVYLQGELQIYYIPLAIVVALGQLASLFVAFTFVPALASKLLSATAAEPHPEGWARQGTALKGTWRERFSVMLGRADASASERRWYVRLYAGLLGFTLRHPWVTAVMTLAMLGGSYHTFDKYVTRGVLWRSWWGGSTYIAINISLPRGEELERTDELTRFFEDRLKGMPEIAKFVTRVTPQSASITVTFPDSIERTDTPVAIKEQLVAFSYQFGGADVRVYGFGPSFYGGGSSPPNYSIQIFGYNYQTVQEIAEDLGRRLKSFSRIRDVDVNSEGRGFTRDRATEITLGLDRRRLAMHGLSAQDVVRHVGAAVRAPAAGLMRLGGDETRYAVKLAGHETVDVLALENLIVPAPGREGVRLADVATLGERQVLSRIVRENQQYQRVVSYEFRGPVKLGDRIRDAVLGATSLPNGYRIVGQQQWSWSTEERRQIAGVLVASLVLIYLVTAAFFESLRQPLCVLLTVPMALIGVFLAFFYANASFTREAYIGVIMMGGVVVNNAILLVDRINQLRRHDGVPLEEAITRGTLQRVRPILMTSATTILGMVPLVLFSESADARIWNALGLALMGGLGSSTLLVLTVTPAVYLLFERRFQWHWPWTPRTI